MSQRDCVDLCTPLYLVVEFKEEFASGELSTSFALTDARPTAPL